VIIRTNDADGTGAVPIEPTVAIMMSNRNDATVTSSPFNTANQMQAQTKYTAPPSILTVAPRLMKKKMQKKKKGKTNGIRYKK
jgi:hypothetical protein